MDMNFELMKICDYEGSFSLWTSTEGMGLRSLDDSTEGINSFLKRNPRTNFICRDKDEIVGTILCGNDGRRGYIYHTVVKDSYRREGIARELVRLVVESLEKEGIKKGALVVYSNNKDGNKFWESLGFKLRSDLSYRNLEIDESNI
jgi:ribosomal protein S18 acetylase RimI-like enzyme